MRTLLYCAAIAGTAEGGLIAYFDFEDGFSDRSLNGVVATNQGGVLTPGLNGTALSLNGISAYVDLGLDINPSVIPNLTMGAWVQANQANGIRQVISHDTGGFDRSIGYDTRAGSGIRWTGWTGSVIPTDEPVTPDDIVFLAIVFDSVEGLTRLHVGDRVYSSNDTPGVGRSTTRIGSNPTFGEYFDGLIDDVFFFDEALSPAQIDAIRQSGVFVSCNAADLAEPEDVLDLSDVNAFVMGFVSQDPIADVAAPFGVFDLNDVGTFIVAFKSGCP